MHGASRESAADLDERLDQLLAEVPDPSERGYVGENLLGVADVLDAERVLVRTLTEATLAPEARAGLVDQLFGARLAPPVVDLLRVAVRERWSGPGDLADVLEELGLGALFAGAEAAGQLDAVEDELFRFGRVLDREPGLRSALGDPALPAERKVELVRSLLADRAQPLTVALVSRAVSHPRGRPVERSLEQYAERAARRRDRLVAEVSTAVPLSAEQESRLGAVLHRIYGRAVTLQVSLDPAVMGGVAVRVGDELIDGTVAARLAAAARRVTGY